MLMNPVELAVVVDLSLSVATEVWSWNDGKIQCYKGRQLVKEQDDTPADVWDLFDERWPDQGGKRWKHWKSSTREIFYS